MKIAIGSEKSMNFGANFILISNSKEKEQTQKDLQDKIAYVVVELKVFFALNGVLEKWKMCP